MSYEVCRLRREEYEKMFGVTVPGSIGCRLYADDGKTLIREYVFIDGPTDHEEAFQRSLTLQDRLLMQRARIGL